MSENYESKAEMILTKRADLLDDGKVVMVEAGRFQRDFWSAYSKQIPREVINPSSKESILFIHGICPTCGNHISGLPNRMAYCSYCGQKVLFSEDI